MYIFEILLCLSIGVAITIKAPTLILTVLGNESLSLTMSSLSLRVALCLSIIYILIQRKSITPIVCVLAILASMILIQPYNIDTSLYSHKIIIVGLSGFVCGYSISNPLNLIKATGGLSIMYGICYIALVLLGFNEQFDSMILGYTLTPIVCWLILLWFISTRARFWLVMEIFVLIVIMLLMSSRGCIITIAAAIIAITFFNNYKKGMRLGDFVKIYIPVIFLVYVAYVLIVPILAKSDMALSGSFLHKMNDSMLLDDNGRDDISTMAIDLIQDNIIGGVGICRDREILGYVFPHNIFIEIFLHYGIPIGLFILIMYWTNIINLIRNKHIRITSIALIVIMCCYTWIRLLVSDTYIDNMYPLLFILGVCFSIKNKPISSAC